MTISPADLAAQIEAQAVSIGQMAAAAEAGVLLALATIPKPQEPMAPEARAAYVEAVVAALAPTWTPAALAALAAIDVLQGAMRIYDLCRRTVTEAAGIKNPPSVAIELTHLRRVISEDLSLLASAHGETSHG